MNTVNETKTFSSLPEEESALWERMRDTLLCLQTDNSISVKDLASRLAYSTQEFLYLADIFFDNSLDAIREQVQGLNIEEDYTNQVLPFERIPDSSMIEYKVVRRMAQTVEADMLPLEGDVFQNGMEYIEKDVKEKWKERERAGEYMQFWWHDDSYHFFYMIGQEVPKDAGRKSEKKRIDFGASDYAVFTLKEQYWDKQAPDMIKMLIKYALCDWIKQSEMHYDNRKMYFISFENGLYSVYLPLEKRMHSDYVMKNKKEEKKIYGVDEWISYIDEHITENLTGNRAATYHEDFIIQCSDKLDNVIYAAGIQSPGLASSPAIAERVEHLLLGICPDIEKDENYNPVREEVNPFRFCSMEEREQRIKENPLYGRIICRCESVTEGEIVDAIHGKVPAVNIDAIKRRTRAGMGRCQGGFCQAKVLEILARELEIPETEVTLKGADSNILKEETRQVRDNA